MNGGSHIIDLRPDAADAAGEEDLQARVIVNEPADLFADPDDEEAAIGGRGIWPVMGGIAALVAGAGWIAGMLWLSWPRLASGLQPLELVNFVAALCVPLVLLAILWLLLMRSSTAEARRFGATAAKLRAEARSLEHAIAAMSQRIDSNREALAAQTHELLKMGDGANQQLVAISNGMGHEIAAADAHTRKLAEAIATAQTNLSVLLVSLPKAHDETTEMAQTLQATGLTAGEQAAALSAQIASLTERGREANDIAGGAAQTLAAHIARMEATSETAGARLEAVTAAMSDAVDQLLDRTAGAVDEARKGIAAQGEAMLAMLEANQAALDRASRDSIEALSTRIESVETVIDRIAARLDAQRAASEALVEKADADFTAVEAKVSAFHTQSIDRTQTLAASISALGGSADAMTEALKTGDDMAHAVIATSEQLLIALDAAAREIDETLPDALARLDSRIANSRGVVAAAKPELLALVAAAESTHDAIEAIAQVIQGQRVTLDELSTLLVSTLNTGRERASDIGSALDEAIARTHNFAEQSAPKLIEALIRVRETATTAADRARETLATVIPEAARSLELASAQAMQVALGNSVEKQISAVAEAAEAAVGAASRASERLTRQMMTIAETTSLVENRIEDAREEREKADSDGFSRRASLLIESLNSASIDIAKHFSADVADSAWSAYLKGDRGVFTRRAVRLLDGGDSREIAKLYDENASFREQVNRYIHDFEAMLRTVLAQRDGAPMSVTLLSSDMGKLYVALAQAIERLRA